MAELARGNMIGPDPDPYFVPPHVSPTRLREMFHGTALEQDYASAYLQGWHHGKVTLLGGQCTEADCGERLRTITTRGPHGMGEIHVELPMRVTWQQLRQGGTCNHCGGRLRFDFTDGPEGGPMHSIAPAKGAISERPI